MLKYLKYRLQMYKLMHKQHITG